MPDEYSSGDIIKSANTEFTKLWDAITTELAKRISTGTAGNSTNSYGAYQTAKNQSHPETQNSTIAHNPYAQHILNIIANSHLAGAAALSEKNIGDIIPNLTAYYTVINNAATATENTTHGGCDGACTGYCVGSCHGRSSANSGCANSNCTNNGDVSFGSNHCDSCSTQCGTVTCGASCSGVCQRECTKHCGIGCTHACGNGCQGKCKTACMGTCGAEATSRTEDMQ